MKNNFTEHELWTIATTILAEYHRARKDESFEDKKELAKIFVKVKQMINESNETNE